MSTNIHVRDKGRKAIIVSSPQFWLSAGTPYSLEQKEHYAIIIFLKILLKHVRSRWGDMATNKVIRLRFPPRTYGWPSCFLFLEFLCASLDPQISYTDWGFPWVSQPLQTIVVTVSHNTARVLPSMFIPIYCSTIILLFKAIWVYLLTASLTLRRLMSYIYIYGAPILDVSRSHTTTQLSR